MATILARRQNTPGTAGPQAGRVAQLAAQHVVHRDDLLGHLDQLLLAAHGLASHEGIGLLLVAAFHLHQQPLGQFYALALGQLRFPGLQFGAQGLIALEARHGTSRIGCRREAWMPSTM